MASNELPLREISIDQLFMGNDRKIYEIPIYQRNYAWEKDEISALVHDVYDAYEKDSGQPYYIGTLVSYHKGDGIYEIIDGQQRLTTIRILLGVLGIQPTSKLTYRARKKSDDTLKAIPRVEKGQKNEPRFEIDEKDLGIEYGFRYAKSAIEELGLADCEDGFIEYFRRNVRIIHYVVPKDIDLNHYFEIMNSRGEQLEKHEIEKAKLMQQLKDGDERLVFSRIWDCCAEMSAYTQQSLSDFKPEAVFGQGLEELIPGSFDELVNEYRVEKKDKNVEQGTVSISDIINSENTGRWTKFEEEIEKKDSFQPIIDFPNFLLIVLKICRLKDKDFKIEEFKLDDKELLDEFDKSKMPPDKIKEFAFVLLRSKFLLDNYIVHHSKEEDTVDSNPWKIQVRHKEGNKASLKNLVEDVALQDRLVHLLSMFEVSFTPRQRKNYLFYCLLYLLSVTENNKKVDAGQYAEFIENLADRYFNKVYLVDDKLNAIKTPLPGSFDDAIIVEGKLDTAPIAWKDKDTFVEVYGDGTSKSDGVSLFVFNYMDYKIWKKYDVELRGKKLKENATARKRFFDALGCSDFGLDEFDQFYFSRTRRSLEHYYPQASATGVAGALDQDQINCFGNYAMIGSEANSSGSDWPPTVKLDHYLESSRKINPISVASLKFRIMMQMCKDNKKWEFDEIKEHQDHMMDLLFG